MRRCEYCKDTPAPHEYQSPLVNVTITGCEVEVLLRGLWASILCTFRSGTLISRDSTYPVANHRHSSCYFSCLVQPRLPDLEVVKWCKPNHEVGCHNGFNQFSCEAQAIPSVPASALWTFGRWKTLECAHEDFLLLSKHLLTSPEM